MSIVKISIVVPVYNTGSMLDRCIKSILNQSMKEIELIIVDDGSTDESPKLCDDFAEEDKRVKVIHKKNEGVSVARNIGIQAAQGEYIGFVDSDDWIDENMYSNMYCGAKKYGADIVMCDATTKYDDKPSEPDTIAQLPGSCILTKTDIYPSLLMEMAGAVWRCIYSRKLLTENNIIFPVGLKFSEDRIFNILAMGECRNLFYTKKSYYYRYVRKGSAVNKYYENMPEMVLDARKRTMEAIDEAWDGDHKYKAMYEDQTAGFALTAINNEFYKDAESSFRQRYNKVKKLCSAPEIINAIAVSGRNDIRSRLIMKKRIFPLCIIAMVLNKRHGR